ncbi:MAG: response regulator [Magnetococcus sp. YQC-5]
MKTIIIVDDDSIFRFYLVTVLRGAGYMVLEAENGEVCLERINSTSIDLVITDILMPKMDGIDLLANLMRNHPHIKVIAISGGHPNVHSQRILEMARSFGAMDIIAKPFATETFLYRIMKIFQSTHGSLEDNNDEYCNRISGVA